MHEYVQNHRITVLPKGITPITVRGIEVGPVKYCDKRETADYFERCPYLFVKDCGKCPEKKN